MKDTQVTQNPPSKGTPRPNVVQQLRTEAETNKALNAVCHIFAIRERARQQVTLAALKQTMVREGFHFSDKEYISVLTFLAKIGIGRLDRDSKGRVRSLKDIKITLQSLGMAGVAKAETFSTFVPRHRYINLVPTGNKEAPNVEPAQVVTPPPVADGNKKMFRDVKLTAIINGAAVSFDIADAIEATTLGELLAGLYAEKGHA